MTDKLSSYDLATMLDYEPIWKFEEIAKKNNLAIVFPISNECLDFIYFSGSLTGCFYVEDLGSYYFKINDNKIVQSNEYETLDYISISISDKEDYGYQLTSNIPYSSFKMEYYNDADFKKTRLGIVFDLIDLQCKSFYEVKKD